MIRTVLLALAAGVVAPAASAEPFVLLIHESPDQIALRADPGAAGQTYWAAYAAWGAEAQAAGILRGGAPFAPEAQVVGKAPAAGLVTGGFFRIDVADAAAARAWAERLPAAATGAVEVRAVLPTPGM